MERDPKAEGQIEPQCVHCGLCLDACPTYRITGLEAESPRGRLYLMAAAATDGSLDAATTRHLDSCLGCLGCETACPSGVRYGDRIESFRPRIAQSRHTARRVATKLVVGMARSRLLLRASVRVAGVLDALGLARMRRRIPGLGLVPAHARTRGRVPESPRTPHPRARVVVMHGCGTEELRPSIAESSLEVLRHNEFDVVELGASHCCGALSLHAGDVVTARELARETATALARKHADFVVTSAAGCGAMLRRYETFLADDLTVHEAARWVSANTRDVSEALVDAGLCKPTPGMGNDWLVAYHDACHLLHASGVAAAPRALLAAAGATAVDLGENDICCGSAGTYNLLQPRSALRLGSRKADLIASARVDTIAVGNIGCILQLERALAIRGLAGISVYHPVELLARAYRKQPQ